VDYTTSNSSNVILTLNLVRCIYLRGGGDKISHNWSETCDNINKLSRLVVQTYEPVAGSNTLWWPLTACIQHASGRHEAPTYLYLHAESLLCSLDVRCPRPIDDSPPGLYLHRGLRMIHPHRDLVSGQSELKKHQNILSRFLVALAAASRMKRKRDDFEDVVPSKRIRLAEQEPEGCDKGEKRIIIRGPGSTKRR
jgi:hypothetical protein